MLQKEQKAEARAEMKASPQGQLREAIEHLESAVSGLDHGREASAIDTNLKAAKEIVGLVLQR